MGLTVVHGIVENHEGAALVEIEHEKRTMVTVYFPSVDVRKNRRNHS